MVRVNTLIIILTLVSFLLLTSMYGGIKHSVNTYTLLSDAKKGVPAAGLPKDGHQKVAKGKMARRLMQDDQDYDYYDFYRKHEDIPSPGIGH